ncbi:hypothetical protein LJR090_001803 [Bosea sp. LjRoot90]|uniref:hypothetical protein n=1 Tax=Bosea sp. LjRoot90 TaxID=3342342 RepID=UPI003ECFAD4B
MQAFYAARPYGLLAFWLALGLLCGWASKVLFLPGWPFAPFADSILLRCLAAYATYLVVQPSVAAVLGPTWLAIWRWYQSDHLPTWIALRRLGESSAVKLTALAPVLGSLILMNDEIAALLRSTLLDAAVGHKSAPLLGFLPVPRLHIIYLGLSFMGIGAILFGLFCPDVIKRYPSAEAWLQGEDRLLNGGRLRGEFTLLLDNYWDSTESQPREDPSPEDEDDWNAPSRFWRDAGPGYSGSRYDQVHQLITDIIEKHDPSGYENDPPSTMSDILGPDGRPAIREPFFDEDQSDYFTRFRMGPQAHINTAAWIDVAWGGRAVERSLRESIFRTAVNFFKEPIVHIRFLDLAHTHRGARAFIASIYGLGIALLTVPTLHTFAAIVASALSR